MSEYNRLLSTRVKGNFHTLKDEEDEGTSGNIYCANNIYCSGSIAVPLVTGEAGVDWSLVVSAQNFNSYLEDFGLTRNTDLAAFYLTGNLFLQNTTTSQYESVITSGQLETDVTNILSGKYLTFTIGTNRWTIGNGATLWRMDTADPANLYEYIHSGSFQQALTDLETIRGTTYDALNDVYTYTSTIDFSGTVNLPYTTTVADEAGTTTSSLTNFCSNVVDTRLGEWGVTFDEATDLITFAPTTLYLPASTSILDSQGARVGLVNTTSFATEFISALSNINITADYLAGSDQNRFILSNRRLFVNAGEQTPDNITITTDGIIRCYATLDADLDNPYVPTTAWVNARITQLMEDAGIENIEGVVSFNPDVSLTIPSDVAIRSSPTDIKTLSAFIASVINGWGLSYDGTSTNYNNTIATDANGTGIATTAWVQSRLAELSDPDGVVESAFTDRGIEFANNELELATDGGTTLIIPSDTKIYINALEQPTLGNFIDSYLQDLATEEWVNTLVGFDETTNSFELESVTVTNELKVTASYTGLENNTTVPTTAWVNTRISDIEQSINTIEGTILPLNNGETELNFAKTATFDYSISTGHQYTGTEDNNLVATTSWTNDYVKTPLSNRISTLEGYNAGTRLTTLEGYDAGTRLTTLEGYNAGTRLTSLETKTDTITFDDTWANGGRHVFDNLRVDHYQFVNEGLYIGKTYTGTEDDNEVPTTAWTNTYIKTPLSTRLTTLEGYDADTRLTTLETFKTTIEDLTINQRLIALENQIQSMNTRVQALENQNLDTRLTTLENSIQSIQDITQFFSVQPTGNDAGYTFVQHTGSLFPYKLIIKDCYVRIDESCFMKSALWVNKDVVTGEDFVAGGGFPNPI